MTDPSRSSGKDSEQLLAEALRARAGGTPGLGRPKGSTRTSTSIGSRAVAARQPLTLLQLILASAIGGVVIGILVAVLTLM